MDRLISIFTQLLNAWRAIDATISEDFAAYGLQNIKRDDVRQFLENQLNTFTTFKAFGYELSGFDQRFISQSMNLENNWQPVLSWIQQFNSNPHAHAQNIVNTLDSWKVQFQQRGLFSDNALLRDLTEKQALKVKQVEDHLSAIEKAQDQFIRVSGELDSMAKRASELIISSERSIDTIRIRRDETEVITTKLVQAFSDIDELRAKTDKAVGEFNQSLGELDKKRSDLSQMASQLQEASATALTKAELIENTLAAANRVGLAKSFEERRKQLRWPILIWGATFLGSIAALCAVAIKYVLPSISTASGPDMYIKLLFELPLTAPLIWLGFFSAARYSYAEKVREDYAFKAATALSLEGFKKEAAHVDPTLLRELLSISIANFGQNPLRLYEKRPSEISPATHLLDNEILQNASKKLLDKIPSIEKLPALHKEQA